MKKIILFFIMIIPFNVFAYSEYIIPGGETIGISIDSEGIVVMGFYKIDGIYINQSLEVGDRIISVNGNNVSSVKELTLELEKNVDNINIEYIRDDMKYNGTIELKKVDGVYKSGLYIRSNVVGIGTLTYIDNDVYGALGHVVNYSGLNERVEIKDGNTFFSDVTNFIKSRNGNPGSKNANIFYDKKFGNIKVNTKYGIYGIVDNNIEKEKLSVGYIDEVMLGSASIYTSNIDDEVKEYEIKIIEIDRESVEKNIYFEIIDKELLEMSGGIVQGMSGSPIIQNNKIIGAVTRVLIDDVTKGYGISIITMLKEGDKLMQN